MYLGSEGCGEGQPQPQGTKLSEIRPIVVDTPQNAFFNSFIPYCTSKGGRGVATESGEKLEDEAVNVPYKKTIDKNPIDIDMVQKKTPQENFLECLDVFCI